VQVGEELAVDELTEVVSGHRPVVVDLAVALPGRGPCRPAVRLLEDVAVLLPLELRLGRLVLLQAVEVLEEEEPAGLLGVVELRGAAGLLSEDVVDVAEGLFELRVG
jgi:hypothetical protein